MAENAHCVHQEMAMTAHEPSHASHFDDSIGLIAGAGSVPKEIAEAVIDAGRDVHVIALRGIADADYTRIPHSVVERCAGFRTLATLA